jgi:UDP-glucose 4-epimerase
LLDECLTRSINTFKVKNIFITGGAGYIGSHCVIALAKNGYTPIILDNFSNSKKNVVSKLETITKKKIIFYNVDLNNKKKIRAIFDRHHCYSIIHCAGLKSVSESLKKPTSYFKNNIGSTLSLLECMQEKKIFKLIFSSSASVYNLNQALPLTENAETGNIENPYSKSKYIIEQILINLVKTDPRWSIKIARYFNPFSNHFSGLIKENPKNIPNNLFPLIIKVAKKKLPVLKVFGNDYATKDGTGIRDYIHVMDLAEGHVAMLKKIKSRGVKIYNFGTGKGFSVLEVIKAFEKKIGISIPFKFQKRRMGDVAISLCCPKKALKELSWKASYNLDQSMIDIGKII